MVGDHLAEAAFDESIVNFKFGWVAVIAAKRVGQSQVVASLHLAFLFSLHFFMELVDVSQRLGNWPRHLLVQILVALSGALQAGEDEVVRALLADVVVQPG